MFEEKEKKIRVTITLKKILNRDSGINVNSKRYFEAFYDGEIPKETVEIMLKKIKSNITDMDKEIDKK